MKLKTYSLAFRGQAHKPDCRVVTAKNRVEAARAFCPNRPTDLVVGVTRAGYIRFLIFPAGWSPKIETARERIVCLGEV
jgi:hypothetical protein